MESKDATEDEERAMEGTVLRQYAGPEVETGLPRWLSGKESTCQCRRSGFNPWVGKILRRRKNGNLLQYSCLGNPLDGGAGWATAHKVAKIWAGLSD